MIQISSNRNPVTADLFIASSIGNIIVPQTLLVSRKNRSFSPIPYAQGFAIFCARLYCRAQKNAISCAYYLGYAQIFGISCAYHKSNTDSIVSTLVFSFEL